MKKRFLPLLSILLLAGCIHSRTAAKLPAPPSLAELKQGIPTTADKLNLTEIPDEQNGALVYAEAAGIIDTLYQRHKAEWEFFPAEGSVKWEYVSKADKEKVADLILHNPDFIRMYQLIDKASLMKSRFLTRDALQKWISEFPDGTLSFSSLAKLRNCARLLVAKATVEADRGDIDDALKTCLTGLRMGKSLSDEPFLLSQMVRMALDAITVSGSLERTLQKGDGDGALYAAIIKELRTETDANMINYGMPGDLITNDLLYFSRWRSLGGRMFELNEDDRKTLEKIVEMQKNVTSGYAPNIEATKKRLQEKRAVLKEAYIKSRCRTPQKFVDMQEAFYMDRVLRVFALTQRPFWETRDELKKIDDEIRNAPKEQVILIHEILDPEHSSMFTGRSTQEARTDALLGTAEIALANRIYRQKHGTFADSLKQLTPDILPALPPDPFTGKDYIYRKTEKGFIVYSIGDNMKDDGGVEKGTSATPDIVWEDKGAQ